MRRLLIYNFTIQFAKIIPKTTAFPFSPSSHLNSNQKNPLVLLGYLSVDEGLDDYMAAPGNTRLKNMLLEKDNRICADCSAPDPKWASASIGVFICLKCCGVHRSLGTHVSRVLSVTLDDWSDEEIDALVEIGGNAAANSIYEAYFPEGVKKPGPHASNEERSKYIRAKYETQDFINPSLRINSESSNKDSPEKSSSQKFIDELKSSSPKDEEGMVEFIGVIKVKVIGGRNLAVRDVLTSDPYVLVKLGQQVQTTVVKSNLNPVWNEELMLSVPQNYGLLKVEVYDQDMLSADDTMGEAEVDIQPMINSAMAYGDASMFANMQIGKWLKSDDNALTEDSAVDIIDGKVKQKMTLKLMNVESGEMDLEVEWMPLEQ